MFNAVQKQMNRPPATGKARIFKNSVVIAIFLFAGFLMQQMQVDSVTKALGEMQKSVETVTVDNTKMISKTRDRFENEYGNLDKFFADPIFTDDGSPMNVNDRLAASIASEIDSVNVDAKTTQRTSIVFDMSQAIHIPNARNAIKDFDQNLANYFNGDQYREYFKVQQQTNDFNAAVQYCQGDKQKVPYGFEEVLDSLTDEQKNERSTAIRDAADRTLCADKSKFERIAAKK